MTWDEVKTLAEAEFTSGRLIGKEYASFLLGALQTQMQIDAEAGVRTEQIAASNAKTAIEQAQSAKDLLVKDAQIAASNAKTAIEQAQSAKDLLVKDAQIASETSRKLLMDQQKLTEVQQTAKALYEATNILPAQKDQTANQALLIARQTVGFDDKKRVEKADKLANAVGMIYASGGTVPSDAWTEVKTAVSNI